LCERQIINNEGGKLMKKVIWLSFVCLASLAFVVGGAWGIDTEVYCVSNATELQDTLDDAGSDGLPSLIQVVQGTYRGNFSYSSSEGYSLTLEGGYTSGCAGRKLNPANSVLDAGGSGKVLSVSDDSGGDISIEGFTIRNGSSSGGAGITASVTADIIGDLTITNNIISGNVASGCGGGVYANLKTSSGTAGNITLANNIITGNSAETSNGGGVFAWSHADSTGTAGNVTLVNNVIAGNTAGYWAGGVLADSEAPSGTPGTVTLTNNTITGNSAATSGGGVRLEAGENQTVDCYNNIIRGNTAPAGEGGDIKLYGTDGTATASHNNYSDMSGSWDSESAKMDDDPQFIDPDYGDYRLRSSSGCINEGTDTAPELPTTDFEGDSRPIDTYYDIGADECSVVTTCVNTAGGLTTALTTNAGGNNIGDVIMVEQGFYEGNFSYNSGQGYGITVLGGYTTGCASRELDPTNTVLDGGEGTDSVLYLYSTVPEDVQVEGFTFQNGNSTSGSGGGFYADTRGGDITVAYNIMTGNTVAGYGGGAWVKSYVPGTGAAGDITLTSNTVIGNSCEGMYGGGLYISSSSASGASGAVVLDNNIVSGNSGGTEVSSGIGGGIYARSVAGTSSGGITLTTNLITGNTSDGAGGTCLQSVGVSGTAGAVTCTNNTITGNVASNGRAGGIEISMDDNIINFYNNISWGNTADTSGDDIYLNDTGTADGYNNLYTDLDGSVLTDWTNSGDNQVGVDPSFVDNGSWDGDTWVDGDYHLLPGSDCIDTGYNIAPEIPDYDFEGDDRIIDGDGDTTETVDIGADEYEFSLLPIFHGHDFDGNGTSDISVFRPSNGYWYVRGGSYVKWGTSGDIPVNGDYDGNGTTDIAVFRPSNGSWYVRGGR
jgi:hypothetical protein